MLDKNGSKVLEWYDQVNPLKIPVHKEVKQTGEFLNHEPGALLMDRLVRGGPGWGSNI